MQIDRCTTRVSVDLSPASDMDDRARALNHRFYGWSVWYGHATGRWWALAPQWGHILVGLIEAGSPEELVLRMNGIELTCPFAVGEPSTEPPGAGDRHGPPTGRTARH